MVTMSGTHAAHSKQSLHTQLSAFWLRSVQQKNRLSQPATAASDAKSRFLLRCVLSVFGDASCLHTTQGSL